jgi:DNA polymerase-3 subunit alpha
MLQGACRISEMLSKVKELGQNSIALTDHGNMFGMLEFVTSAEKAEVKPIIGCDLYIAPDSRHNRIYEPGSTLYHKLILLAKNQEGYQNLLKICSAGHLEGYYQKPRVDREVLEQHKGGLICLTGNYQGELGHSLIHGTKDQQSRILEFLEATFGKEDVYLCLQDHGHDEEHKCNQAFLQLHQEQGYALVAVNDVHYIAAEDHKAHEVLLCIEAGYKLADPNHPQWCSDQYYLRSTEEMVQLFGQYPEAIENTVRIADKCNVTIEFGKLYWPKFDTPKEYKDDDEFLAYLAREGVQKRYNTVTEDISNRLEYELEIMKKMDVAGYMLITQDLINAARGMDIPVGPGRGSAVGSLVSYAIGITDVDPLRFSLLFERFLNPERVSMPDIDTDFSDKDRGKIIEYVTKKYGQESVTQIVTYGRMKAKMVIRDVGRVLGFEASEVNRLCKLFPPDLPFADLTKAIASSPDLKEELDSTEETRQLRDVAFQLEGFVRQAGMHAAAVIIAPEPVVNFAPLFKQPGSDQVMIQYDKQFSEDIGLLKMDFLGLRNLSVIQECITEIEKAHNIRIDPLAIPEKDPKTLELLGKGLTVGVFQFESGGMQEYLKKLKPDGIEDLIAMNALYRPGPIENIPSYIARKNGREALDYYHEDLKPILGETYGVIVYQEQVMQIAQELSGFTLGGADEMRRVMAKKNEAKMAKLKPKFVNGAKERGYDPQIAERIWDVLVPFSSYAFNKSHSAAYSTIAYQTAYLKAHYPAQFIAANMSSELDNTDRLVVLLNDCRELGLEVVKPDVNLSKTHFSSKDTSIIYGLAGIKNVGVSAAEKIVEERSLNGPFTSILDLCRRIDVGELNRRAIESLIYAGALDKLHGTRSQQFASVEPAFALATKEQRDKEMGQGSLFGIDSEEGSSSGNFQELEEPDVDPWPYNEMLGKEKEVLGLYLSGHPLEPFRMELESFSSSPLDDNHLSQLQPGSNVILGGSLSRLRTKISQKDGRAFAFGELEDFAGKIEITFWSDVYEECREYIEPDAMILIRGIFKTDPERPNSYKLNATKVLSIEESRYRLTKNIHVRLTTMGLQKETLQKIHELCSEFPGNTKLTLHMETEQLGPHQVSCQGVMVSPESEFTEALIQLAGRGNVWLSSKESY